MRRGAVVAGGAPGLRCRPWASWFSLLAVPVTITIDHVATDRRVMGFFFTRRAMAW